LIFQQTEDPSITLPPWPFRVACAAYAGASAASPPEELLARMAAAAGVLYNASGRETCYDLPNDPNFDGIWDYQWCTERLPQETYFTIDGKRDIFWDRPANATAIAEHCEATYAVAPKGNWVAATSEFGRASSASNIVFSNGEYDPWRSGGVLTNLSDTLLAVDIAQGAHHLDLFFSDPADPPSVIAARQVEVAAIRRWVGM
jgi:lysosomal Pro-X carboxypeptidase